MLGESPPPPPEEVLQMKVLSSANSCILRSFLRWDTFSFTISSSEIKVIFILKNSEIFSNECVDLDSFHNTNIKITCRVWMSGQEIERTTNYDELSDINLPIQKIRTSSTFFTKPYILRLEYRISKPNINFVNHTVAISDCKWQLSLLKTTYFCTT